MNATYRKTAQTAACTLKIGDRVLCPNTGDDLMVLNARQIMGSMVELKLINVDEDDDAVGIPAERIVSRLQMFATLLVSEPAREVVRREPVLDLDDEDEEDGPNPGKYLVVGGLLILALTSVFTKPWLALSFVTQAIMWSLVL